MSATARSAPGSFIYDEPDRRTNQPRSRLHLLRASVVKVADSLQVRSDFGVSAQVPAGTHLMVGQEGVDAGLVVGIVED